MVSAPPLPALSAPPLCFERSDSSRLSAGGDFTSGGPPEGRRQKGDVSLLFAPFVSCTYDDLKKKQHNFPSSVSPFFPSYLHVSRLVALPVIPRWWHLEKTCAITLLDIVSSPRANSSAVISRISRCPFIEMIEIWHRDSPGEEKGGNKAIRREQPRL